MKVQPKALPRLTFNAETNSARFINTEMETFEPTNDLESNSEGIMGPKVNDISEEHLILTKLQEIQKAKNNAKIKAKSIKAEVRALKNDKN